MLNRIMIFVDRHYELERLTALAARPAGGLAVVFGRRRIGKTRLLVEWCRRHDGVYAVADQSSPDVQRRYLAQALAVKLRGFADVEYRDWNALLERLASDARATKWRGPIVLDELPYWIASSPELPSLLQRWIDHAARDARLVIGVAGSSQRMMQGLALSRDAPLYGRAQELFEVAPLELAFVRHVMGRLKPHDVVQFHAAWGGVPRYWELAAELRGSVREAIDRLVLDPRGPLHREPDRLLLEEVPSAMEVRPVLDAIGGGAHRVSEIAGRLGRPATSLARPLERLIELGLARREVPFGEHARASRRSHYTLADPFTRLWFRVVAPHRGELVSGARRNRLALLDRYWSSLTASAWEEICRHRLPWCAHPALGKAATWTTGSRWWHGNAPEWDIVAEDVAGKRLLLGEAKLSANGALAVERLAMEVAARPAPPLPAKYGRHRVIRALFVPDGMRRSEIGGVAIVSLRHLLGR